MTPVMPFYDTTIGTQRFYGGATIYHANTEKTGFSEDGMNDFEEGMCNQPRRNWTLFHETYEIFSPFRMYYLAVWPKWDFMNGGDRYRVSFDDESELAFLVMRYHMGMEGWRWVVRNGEDFYISEKTFFGAGENPGGSGGKAHVVRPALERWAEHRPTAPYRVDFDPKAAEFTQRQFDNVTGVGWYMFKDRLVSGYVGCKWYAFEADAVVHRPKRPSENIDMVKVEWAGDAFYIATCETPYELWRKVHRLKRSNTFVREKNFTFDKYGDLGSMDLSAALGRDDEFSQDEPVTDVTLYDVLAWCNALSVQESKTPCYYIDPEREDVFREVKRSRLYVDELRLPAIHVKWDADGYRLPTVAEWQAALGTDPKSEIPNPKSSSTHPVGTRNPSDKGLYDMLGNVWECVWTHGDVLDPATKPTIILLGGDFSHPANPGTVSASPWGDQPYDGSWNIGFRLVRREPGGAAPPRGERTTDIPTWELTPDTRTRPDRGRQIKAPVAKPLLRMVDVPEAGHALSVCEVSFMEWKQVFNWAQAHGYSFDHSGEMGSMAYWGFGDGWQAGTHRPTEPVTGVTHYDVLVWLNALSELHGRTPAYYADKACTEVYRTSYEFRSMMTLLGEQRELFQSKKIRRGWNEHDPTFVKEDADGFRLPTIAEHRHAAWAGSKKRNEYPWGADGKAVAEFAWTADSSGFRTHPVGRLKPNPFGLHDLLGNVSEWSHDFDVGKNRGCIAERMGGSLLDLVVANVRPGVKRADTTRGLMYPDVGFRALRPK